MAKTATKSRKPKASAGFLPGMKPPSIKALDTAASALAALARAEKAARKKKELKADVVMNLMEKHKFKRYEFDGHVVVIVPGKEKIKVKATTDEEAEQE